MRPHAAANIFRPNTRAFRAKAQPGEQTDCRGPDRGDDFEVGYVLKASVHGFVEGLLVYVDSLAERLVEVFERGGVFRALVSIKAFRGFFGGFFFAFEGDVFELVGKVAMDLFGFGAEGAFVGGALGRVKGGSG